MPAALAKAERYRLLNEPGEAESICLDVLAVDPDNQEALVTLLLALTDQFDDDTVARRRGAGRRSPRLRRRVRARLLHRHHPRAARQGAARARHARLRPARLRVAARGDELFEKAEAIRPAGNDDALLRWNACARLIMRDRHLVPMSEEPASRCCSE